MAKFDMFFLVWLTAPFPKSGDVSSIFLRPFGMLALPHQSRSLTEEPSVVGTPSKIPPHWKSIWLPVPPLHLIASPLYLVAKATVPAGCVTCEVVSEAVFNSPPPFSPV